MALLSRRIFAQVAWKYVENTKLSYIFQSTTVFYTNIALPLLQNSKLLFFLIQNVTGIIFKPISQ